MVPRLQTRADLRPSRGTSKERICFVFLPGPADDLNNKQGTISASLIKLHETPPPVAVGPAGGVWWVRTCTVLLFQSMSSAASFIKEEKKKDQRHLRPEAAVGPESPTRLLVFLGVPDLSHALSHAPSSLLTWSLSPQVCKQPDPPISSQHPDDVMGDTC